MSSSGNSLDPLFKSGHTFQDDYNQARSLLDLKHEKEIQDYQSKFMTGQEWFDRFEKALKHKLYGDCDVTISCDGCSCDAIEVAKRASNLS